MDSQLSSSLPNILPQNASSINVDTRPSAKFPPSTWGDYFLSKTFETMGMDDKVEEKVEELKKDVRKLLITCAEKPFQLLSLIDSIQRLGVAYHFHTEINELLDRLYKNYNVNVVGEESDENLHVTALRVRLLRQQGFSVSCDIFNKFTDDNGKFKESLGNDIQGLLSLYEVSHMRMHGEDILERALAFTTTSLKAAIASNNDDGFATQVRYALKWPLMKAVPRFGTRHYIALYEEDPLHHPILLSFAKLDYGLLQRLYQNELHELSRWWKDLKLAEELFSRDRCVECYVWALGICFEPNYSLARRIITKTAMMATILDDIYDAYGTFEELELFTRAIDQRWDVNCTEGLPKYMKACYEAMMNIYREFEEDIGKDDIPCAIHYAKEAMKREARHLFIEAKWYRDGYIPTIEEYLRVARVSCYYVISPTAFFGMGDAASMKALEWVESDPKLLIAAGVIGRIMNDITSHKFEQKRGHVASAVECYMTQNGVSEKEGIEELEKQVTAAWKEIIEDYVQSTDVPNANLVHVINIARLSHLFYKDGDGFTFPDGEIKVFITSLLVDPMPI